MRTSATHPPNILPFPLRWHVWHVFFACGNSVSPTENHQKLNQKPWSRNLGGGVSATSFFFVKVSSSPRFEGPPKPMIRNITMTETSWFFEPWDPLNLNQVNHKSKIHYNPNPQSLALLLPRSFPGLWKKWVKTQTVGFKDRKKCPIPIPGNASSVGANLQKHPKQD